LLDVAVNVVGSDVMDCQETGSATCYGSAYLEYDLRHSAFNVPIDDYVGDVRCFDFAEAAIRGGKALAAERFITLPLGSADADLIHQSAFLKSELSGRPLSGTYHFRLKDVPGLIWGHVDDIQLIINHRYWSRVDRTAN
jgi:hypothetical protein